MTPDHPAIETLADQRAGLLPEDENATVSAHVAACAECSAASDAIADVSALLAGTGAEPVPMPAKVVARVDSTLRRASAERAGNVVTLDRPSTVEAAAAPRRTWPVLAAAAAAAVIVGGGATLANSDLLGGGGASDAAQRSQVEVGDAGDGEAAQGGAAAGGAAGETEDRPQKSEDSSAPRPADSLSPSDIQAYATRLDRSATGSTSVSRTCAPVRVPRDGVVSEVRWRGGRATLVVDTESRTATVLDCATASRVLFQSGY